MPPQELAEDDDEDIDEAELNLDKVEEEMAADYSDEEEDEILHIDEFSAILNAGGNAITTNSSSGVGAWPMERHYHNDQMKFYNLTQTSKHGILKWKESHHN